MLVLYPEMVGVVCPSIMYFFDINIYHLTGEASSWVHHLLSSSTSVMAEQRNWKSCVLNFQAPVLPKQIIWFAASVSARLHLWILAFRRWCTQEDVSQEINN